MKNKSKNWFANGNAFISLPVILITLLVFVPMIGSEAELGFELPKTPAA